MLHNMRTKIATKFIQNFTTQKVINIDSHMSYKRILEGNKRYVQTKLAQNPEYFKNLAVGQKPQYLMIGCSDSRVPPNELTQTQPGEMFIHRNIANQVLPTDMNINAVIQYAVEVLEVQNIIVMGHTQCGGVEAACKNQSHGGFLDCWISQIKNIYDKNQEMLDKLPFEQRVNKMVELNVKEGVKNVWKNPYIQKSWKQGKPIWVHGWVIKVETGYVDELTLNDSMPQSLHVFKYDFDAQQQMNDKTDKIKIPS